MCLLFCSPPPTVCSPNLFSKLSSAHTKLHKVIPFFLSVRLPAVDQRRSSSFILRLRLRLLKGKWLPAGFLTNRVSTLTRTFPHKLTHNKPRAQQLGERSNSYRLQFCISFSFFFFLDFKYKPGNNLPLISKT